MAVQLFNWFLSWSLLCFGIRDVTCICNVTCTTDYLEYLECACAGISPPTSVRIEAECSNWENIVHSRCEIRPPQSVCQMRPENFEDLLSTDTECTANATDLDSVAPRVESAKWFLGDIVMSRAPFNVRVSCDADTVNITWDVDNYLSLCLKYRVRIRGPEKIKVLDFVETQYLAMDASRLQLNTLHQAEVQTAPCRTLDSYLHGPWSPWSQAVDIVEASAVVTVPVPGDGVRTLVLCVALPALLCVVVFCCFSKPFFLKKVQFLMIFPDPTPFFEPLHHKYGGNFKNWVGPTFSEADLLVVPTLVPVCSPKLLLNGHHGNQRTEEEEHGGRDDQEWREGSALPGHLDLNMVVLSGGESDEAAPELHWGAGAGSDPDEAEGDGMGGAEEGGPTESGRSPARSLEPGPGPMGTPPASPGWLEPWDDDYPRLDLDTVDSGFVESDCSSPVCPDSPGSDGAGLLPPQQPSAKSNYVRQWMLSQSAALPAQPPHPPPAPTAALSQEARHLGTVAGIEP